MKSWWGASFFALVLAIGCTTSPNPLYCGDGLCSDPAYPFCDVDGSFGETRLTCIAVSCSPGDFVACRGDQALTCNGTGNNYDLIQCERGCGKTAGGCRRCEADEQCASAAPVCDLSTGECRGCIADDECPSTVCDVDNGTCIGENAIVYASPTGIETGPCSRTTPCSTTRAVAVARGDLQRSIVRLLPGVYATRLEIYGDATITVIGTGATIDGGSAASTLGVGDPNNEGVGPNVTIRGLSLEGGGAGCGYGYQSGASVLRLTDVSIKGRPGGNDGFSIGPCASIMRRVEFIDAYLALGERASLDADGIRVIGNGFGASGAITPYQVRVVNSVFDRSSIYFDSQHVATPSQVSFAFNTVVSDSGPALDCRVLGGIIGVGKVIAFVENNIFVSATGDAVTGTKCTTNHNVVFPQAMQIGGTNIVADPLLASPITGDLHLRADSPAIDAAVPSTGLSTGHDFVGTPRPQGGAPDIGAYEFKP